MADNKNYKPAESKETIKTEVEKKVEKPVKTVKKNKIVVF